MDKKIKKKAIFEEILKTLQSIDAELKSLNQKYGYIYIQQSPIINPIGTNPVPYDPINVPQIPGQPIFPIVTCQNLDNDNIRIGEPSQRIES